MFVISKIVIVPKVVIVLLIALLAGCSRISGIPERSIDVETELVLLEGYLRPSVITTYNTMTTNAEKRAYRDEVLLARLRIIDLHFNEFLKGIFSSHKKSSIASDSTIAFLGAAGAVSTVSTTQKVIAATSTALTGTKASFDKNSYYDTTLTALIAQMQANRQRVLVEVYAGMAQGIGQYPLMRALLDTEKYFQAGTLAGAVNEINKQAGKVKTEAEKEIAEILRASHRK